MEQYFIDSNIFLRFYNSDDPEQKNIAKSIFLKAKNREIELFCGPPVFFEVAWVLRSRYKIPSETILNILEAMIAIPNLRVFDEEYVKAALNLARKTKQSYPDSYIAVVANDNNIGVASFNIKHFSKLGVKMYSL
jgi:predicted nucleic-acid-binding protein